MSDQELWQSILGILEVNLSRGNFNTWLKQTRILERLNNTLIISVPSNYHITWITDKYQSEILKALKRLSPEIQNLQYKVNNYGGDIKDKQSKDTNKTIQNNQQTQAVLIGQADEEFGLNPTYKFETFIAGKNNELAHAAAQAVAKNPGSQYNPLFIYGGVGLGKTHLMQAVGQNFLSKNPRAKIYYVSSEKFTNDYIKALQNKKIEAFKNRYRNADMLLIDDIQFIGGKDATQEEFFHTFNELRDHNKQIILTADRLPKDIPGIEQRLISRFEWGMVVDIQIPDMETRLAIVKNKLQNRGANLSTEVAAYLAEQVQTNIRELEGALNKLLVFQNMHNCALTVEQAKSILASVLDAKKKSITLKRIAAITAEFYNVTLDDLIKQSRRKEYVRPRQIAMFLARKELNTSLPIIGDFFGGRDHTTVLHAVDKLETEVNTSINFRQHIDILVEKLYNS